MADKTEKDEIKEYAGGWITERKGTDLPGFLKLAFVVISLGTLAYLFVYMNGEVTHADRGVLVQALNKATKHADLFMYAVGGIGIIYAIVLIVFSFRKFHEK